MLIANIFRRFIYLLIGGHQLPQRKNSTPGTLEGDIFSMSEWISAALQSSGYAADFSPESITEIERFFEEHAEDGEPRPGGLLSEQLGPRLFALGSYCGEVLRRELGGTWLTDDDDPEGDAHIALQFPDGSIVWPVERVVKRLGGADNNIAHWAHVIRKDILSRAPSIS